MSTAPRGQARPGEDPDEVVDRAYAEHQPVACWCLLSGGHDSTVLAHRCREHYHGLVWIDTGTAVPGVAEFVSDYAQWLDKPLLILHAGDAFRTMVLGDLLWWARYIAAHQHEPSLSIEAFIARDTARYGRGSGGELGQCPHGFPGPPAHGRAYLRLKERQLQRLLKESKQGHPRSARVLFLSGVRRAESRRRAKRPAINRAGHSSAVFACPLIDWTGQQTRAYRVEHRIPESPAAALLHRSGECNCGSFAAPGERAMLKALYPTWWKTTIAPLEDQAEAAGIRYCRWGGYDLHGHRAGQRSRHKAGLLCESCEARRSHAHAHASRTRQRPSAAASARRNRLDLRGASR